MGGRIFNKEHSGLEVGTLGVEDTAVGPFVRFKQEDKGSFLLIDFSKSEIFTPDDFQK